MKIKKGDFIELDYIGRTKEEKRLFDTTDEKLAKKENVHNPNMVYGPKIICIGQKNIVPGLDKFLVGKETKKYTVELPCEESFGKKDAKLMKIIPLSTFKKQNIKPFPSLQLNIDGMLGVVRTVSSGRVIVDFNHPLAGHEIMYEITVKRFVKEDKEKLKWFLFVMFQKDVPFKLKDKVATVEIDVPPEVQKELNKKAKELISGLKELKFVKTTTQQ